MTLVLVLESVTRPVIVQPDFSQGYNYPLYPDFDETSGTSLRLA